MSYLIDTDILINVLQGDEESIQLFSDLTPYGLSISAITCMESVQGLLDQAGGARAELAVFLRNVPVLPIDQDVAHHCAVLRNELSHRGKRVRQRALDLLIAATAIEPNPTLVTRNRADYRDIPGLILYERTG